MKYLAYSILLIALCWFGFTRYLSTVAESTVTAPPASTAPASPKPTPAAPTPTPPVVSTPAPGPRVQFVPATPSDSAARATDPNAPIKIDLTAALGPDNHYHDTAVGLDVMLPAGWTIRQAIRWGNNHSENTVFLSPEVGSSAMPSMYYKPYLDTEAATIGATGSEALLREQAQKKEASRVVGLPDYKNVPDSFSFYDVNGSPAMSYFATFTRSGEVMTEHFIRILGPKGYVMFFTSGKFEDVKALMPALKQASTTVKGP